MVKLTVVRSLNSFLSSSNIKKEAIYSIQMSPFGSMMVVTIDKYLCMLKFMPNSPADDGKDIARSKFPFCHCIQSENIQNTFDVSNIKDPDVNTQILVEGTEFYESVWRTLLTIPSGKTVYYSDIANNINKPKAIRAVGSAVGKNPIAYIIPCHRVIGKNNNCFKFASGPEIKKRLLESEGICLSHGPIEATGLLNKSGLGQDRIPAIHSQG